MTIRSLRFTFPALLAALSGGCVTHINTNVTDNPPPAARFADYSHFELDRVALTAPYAGQEANEKARNKIQENVTFKSAPLLQKWESAGANAGNGETLVFSPEIKQIKFINATSRVWAGALAGSSAVLIEVRIFEKESGKVIATPTFYAKAAAMGGAWTFGTTDNLMLARVADRFTSYIAANYDAAVGGPTGAEGND